MSHTVIEIQRYLHQQAREHPHRPVPGLMRLIGDWTVIEAAWGHVKKAKGADTPGADNVDARSLRANPRQTRSWLQTLGNNLQSGTYRPGPVRRFEIAKPGKPDKTRSIAILTLEDRVVHMALKLILEPIIEARLGKRCFGFRPGRGRFDQLHALQQVVRNQPGVFTAALSTDVAACFDQIDHRLLFEDLHAVVADSAVLSLACLLLEQVGSGSRGWLRTRRVGVLQGSPLSPLLANWNLARLDRAWGGRVGDPAPLFRYADDLIILAAHPRAATKLRGELERCLWRSNRMKLADEKTVVRTFDEGVPSLGMMIRVECDRFDGAEKVRVMLDPARIRDVLAEVGQWAENLDPDRSLGRQFELFNAKLRGWFEAYQYAHDAPLAFSTIDEFVFRSTRAGLKSLLGCSASTLQERHYHNLSSGHQTWQADGVELLALGSLPRRYFRPKLPRSPWDRSLKERETIIPREDENDLEPLLNLNIAPVRRAPRPERAPKPAVAQRSVSTQDDARNSAVEPGSSENIAIAVEATDAGNELREDES